MLSSKDWDKIRVQLNGPADYDYEMTMLGSPQGHMTPSDYEFQKAKAAYYGTTTERPW